MTRAAAYAADDAYSAELRRVFGKAAGDARYDARGKSTPELRRLSDAKLAADAATRDAEVLWTYTDRATGEIRNWTRGEQERAAEDNRRMHEIIEERAGRGDDRHEWSA